jgi:acyl-coenzyme A thioesterase PaaI-like protein
MTLPPDPRTTYDAHQPVENEPRARKHALVLAVKRLVELTAHLDVAEVDDLASVDALVDATDALSDRVEVLPSLHAKGGLGAAGGDDSSILERSGISGRSNPLAAPLQFGPVGDRTVGWAVYSPAYEGPIGCVHGGFVAAAFDDLLGSAQVSSGRAGYTGTLTVRMRRPTPLGMRIDYEAGVDRVEGRKIWVWGTAHCDGELLAEAEILFIAPKGGGRPGDPLNRRKGNPRGV